MSLNINMQGDGTHAGVRKPWVGGHSPKCVCSKCRPIENPPQEAKP